MVRKYGSTENFFRQVPSGQAKNLLEKVYHDGIAISTFQSLLMNFYLEKVRKELMNKQTNLAFERSLFSCQFFFTEYHKLKGTIEEIQGELRKVRLELIFKRTCPFYIIIFSTQ
jgi:hypothetical protein